jgi:hypothetical protein
LREPDCLRGCDRHTDAKYSSKHADHSSYHDPSPLAAR